jgi:outer membrane murein-binding lipoprotein Lpp
VSGDVASLSAKLESLTEQCDRFEERAEQRLNAAKEEGVRTKRRARRQMEADEKQVAPSQRDG